MSIKLNQTIEIEQQNKYKIHLACWNGENQPLDVFVKSKEEWKGWNSYKGMRDDFNREFIFSLIEYYHENNTWLFGGIYKVLTRNKKHYEVELQEYLGNYIGRLKIKLKRPGRAKALCLENYYQDMIISEILKECYSGETFCGYENINHDFTRLEIIFENEKPDWKASLENIKGIYLITDKNNGKRYVGSAYGSNGIWSRWSCYLGTGHGWNDDLTKLINQKGFDYARRNFCFTLLEYRNMKTDDSVISKRENYWKEVLLSRGQFGYNKN